jgi:signal peptidase I
VKDGNITITNANDETFTAQNPDGLALNEPYIEAIHESHDTFTTTLATSSYFVMGDNRLQSSDSRAWGDLDRSLIIGKPFVRLLPVSTISFWPGKQSQ